MGVKNCILSGILVSLSAQSMQGTKTPCVTVCQVDVLESQFSQLLHQINSTRDFESIRLAHDHFLSNLLAQSFILLKPVSRPVWFPQTASILTIPRHLELPGYGTIIKQLVNLYY